MKPYLVSGLLILAGLPFAIGAEAPHRHHGAHVHGEATLRVVLEGQLLEIALDAPGMSLLGFEHPPRNDEERAAYAKTRDALRHVDRWLSLPRSADCTRDSVALESHGFDEAGEHDGHASSDTDDEHEHGDAHHEHAELNARYGFTCKQPRALRTIDVALLDHFPALLRINVELVMPDWQGSQTLAQGDRTIVLSKP